jgi:hypothetical protein
MRNLKRFKRVYHPACEWEELRFNMWGSVENKPRFLTKAIEFTGDASAYGDFMDKVVYEWPISCENALTDYSLNRKAWVGAAACALFYQIPEYIVREAWGYLTDEQRKLANRRAAIAIGDWEERYAKSFGLCEYVAEPMLHLWDTGPSARLS